MDSFSPDGFAKSPKYVTDCPHNHWLKSEFKLGTHHAREQVVFTFVFVVSTDGSPNRNCNVMVDFLTSGGPYITDQKQLRWDFLGLLESKKIPSISSARRRNEGGNDCADRIIRYLSFMTVGLVHFI